MILIIGGKAQGKREFAFRSFFAGREVSSVLTAYGTACSFDDLQQAELILDLQEYVRRYQKRGQCSLPRFRDNAVILCEEVGSGIVPLDQEERDFREAVGRAGTLLADHAEKVYLMRFGIPQRIK